MNHYNNASLVEDSLKLLISSSRLAVSTVINYGFWYGICRSPEVVTALTGRFDLPRTEESELQEVKASFCNQLAAVITSTEVALTGHLSLWPLELTWWQPLRFAGTAYVGYQTYTNCPFYPAAVMTAAYLSHEEVARNVAGATTIRALRHKDIGKTQPLNYALSEYKMLSSVAGIIVGAIVYKKMLNRGLTSVKAAFAYMISASLTKTLSTICSLSLPNSGSADRVEKEAGAIAAAGAGAIAGSVAAAGTIALWWHGDLFLDTATLSTIAFAIVIPAHYHIDVARAVVGMTYGVVFLQFLLQQSLELDSRHLMRNIAITLAPALALALFNGLSNHAVYGVTLEESFTETTRNQWKKFYAPLDYLYTLFH
ncbi:MULTISPECIES: hypothetical protein [unclassified Endozoicomonas]|uniref:hypothetical protein n=1 Tax=unclassified Endozoicomonas TaxID=2644528 RepID=UPI002147D34E|nr:MULTISPECIES: hypothetical protein [unclassified Endozoicomonas]